MPIVTRSNSEDSGRASQLGRWAIVASAFAIFVGCGSDENKAASDAEAGAKGLGGNAGASTGGRATAGTSSNARAGAGGVVGGAGAAGRPATAGAGGNAGTPPNSTSNAGSPNWAGSTAGGVSNAGSPSAAGAVGVAGAGATPLGLYVACADTTGSIMQFTLNRTTGAITPVGTYTTGVSNSWATLNAAQNKMYVNSRTTGRITTLSRDTSTGALSVLGTVAVPMTTSLGGGSAGAAGAAGAAGTAGTGNVPAGNPATQTVTLDSSERFLLAANYGANNVYVYSVAADGTLGTVVAAQSDGVQAHQTAFAPGSNNPFVLVPYRASDTIATYQFNTASGALALTRTYQSDADGTAGTTGPRHLVFHPTNSAWVYAINEVAGSVSVLNFNSSTGVLTQLQSLSSVPTDYTGQDKFASEIAVAPSGKFIYVSNRYSTAATYTADGSLGVFAVNATSGQLSPVEFESSRGAVPRHFELSKDGSVLVVGNQNSNNIAVFSVDGTTGALTHKVTRDVCATPFFVKLIGN